MHTRTLPSLTLIIQATVSSDLMRDPYTVCNIRYVHNACKVHLYLHYFEL